MQVVSNFIVSATLGQFRVVIKAVAKESLLLLVTILAASFRSLCSTCNLAPPCAPRDWTSAAELRFNDTTKNFSERILWQQLLGIFKESIARETVDRTKWVCLSQARYLSICTPKYLIWSAILTSERPAEKEGGSASFFEIFLRLGEVQQLSPVSSGHLMTVYCLWAISVKNQIPC